MWFGSVIPPTPVRRGSHGDMGSHGPADIGDHDSALGFPPSVSKQCGSQREKPRFQLLQGHGGCQ